MMAHLEGADELFSPSGFWRDLSRENLRMMDVYGASNFKKSVAQNYFNWAIEAADNPQMQHLLRQWALDPSMRPLEVSLTGSAEIEGVANSRYVTTPASQRAYTLFVGLLWWYVTRHYPGDLPFKLEEPAAGGALDLFLDDGRRISQDLANSLKEWGRIEATVHRLAAQSAARPVVAEFGAGYGRVGYVARQASDCRYWVFDIAPALALAEWYLPTVLPGQTVFRWRPFQTWAEIEDEVMSADLAFFTVDQLPLIPDRKADVFLAISVLHELLPDKAKLMLDMVAQKSGTAVYTRNWTTWDNIWDKVEFRSEVLTAPSGWSADYDRIDDTIGAFTEKLFRRLP
jgi:putative sugar O-methyltransferase